MCEDTGLARVPLLMGAQSERRAHLCHDLGHLGGLVSYACCNRVPRAQWLKPTDTDCLSSSCKSNKAKVRQG